MKSFAKVLFAFLLVALVAGPVLGQGAEKKNKKKGQNTPPAVAQALKKVESLGLTDEQNTKLKSIASEFAPKFVAANKKLSDALTAEQKKAKQDAQAKAKADGLKGKPAAEAVATAVNLTDDQKKVDQEVKDELKKLSADLNTAVLGVLTPEQKEKLPGKKAK